MNILTPDKVPGGAAVLNPFVVVDGAADLIAFVIAVFGGCENTAARTSTPDGRLIHAEVDLGGVKLMDGAKLEDALKKAGVSVERKDYEGVTHEFFGAAAVLQKAREAQAYAGQRLRQAFGG